MLHLWLAPAINLNHSKCKKPFHSTVFQKRRNHRLTNLKEKIIKAVNVLFYDFLSNHGRILPELIFHGL